MRLNRVAVLAVATFVLASGLAFAQIGQSRDGARASDHDDLYAQCLKGADARFEGVRPDLMIGSAGDQIGLRNRAMRAHCAAFGAHQTGKWHGFLQSCQAIASSSGVPGVSLKASHVATMQSVCVAMAQSDNAAQ
jgi:hypothetical protein